jgi:hypothetical protein
MAHALLVLAALLLAGPGLPPQQPAASTLDRLTWMAGEWKMNRGTACIEEQWTRPAGDMLLGMSRTIQGGRTTSFEFMRIVSRADGVYFVAQPDGRPPVDFKLASDSGAELVFVNPGHADHLKRIVYRRPGTGQLAARIEGEDGGKPFSADYVYSASTGGCGR